MIKVASRILISGLVLLLTCCGGGSGLEDNPGEQSQEKTTPGDNVICLNFNGVGLQALTSAPENSIAISDTCTTALISPKEVTRRIDPGEIPNSTSATLPILIDDSNVAISDQLVDQVMLLQVAFAPAVNLITGEPNATGEKPALYAVHVPLRHAGIRDTLVKVEVEIDQDRSGKYFSDTLATYENAGLENTQLTRVNYADGLVCQDSDLDGDFRDEAWLADESRLGISQNLVNRLAAINELGEDETATTTVVGTLTTVDETAGAFLLADAAMYDNTGRIELGELEVGYTEESRFDTRLVSLSGEEYINKAPGLFTTDRQVSFEAEIVTSDPASTDRVFWASHFEDLYLNLPADAIAAVPLKQTALPGEPVTFTVYANQTANPLYKLDQVRVAFETGNEYLSGSLNAGDRGGDPAYADGVWAGMRAASVVLPDDSQRTATSADEETMYIDFELSPVTGDPLLNASGALFNFQLVCGEDLYPRIMAGSETQLVTFYSDQSQTEHTWANTISTPSTMVDVEGEAMCLKLVDPPPHSNADLDEPYLVEPGTSWELRLLDPIYGDITNQPAVEYLIYTSGEEELLSIEDGYLIIDETFSGWIRVWAKFNGLYTLNNSVELFVDKTEEFSLNIHEKQTYILGGSAEGWELTPDPQPDCVNVWVKVKNANDLRALFLDLTFNYEIYRLDSILGRGAMDIGEGLMTADEYAFNRNKESGVSEYAQVLLHPQLNAGVSGTHDLLVFKFKRLATIESLQQTCVPTWTCAALSWDDEANALDWAYALLGDYNQDGKVAICDEAGPAYSDYTILNMYMNETGPFEKDSIQDVIDQDSVPIALCPNYDCLRGNGEITQIEYYVLLDYDFAEMDGWNVHAGPGGAVVGYVPFADSIGDNLTERIHFQWTPPSVKPGATYWVCPTLGEFEGGASNVVEAPEE